MRSIIFLTIFFLSILNQVFAQEYYYWAYNKKYPLELFSEKQYVVIQGNDKETIVRGLGVNEVLISEPKPIIISKTIKSSNLNSLSRKNLHWALVNNVIEKNKLQSSELIYAAPSFLVNGKEVNLSQYFYVKLKNEGDLGILEDMAIKNKVEIIGNDAYMPLWYILSCDKYSRGNALEMANYFYESGLFASAQPDLMEDMNINCANDALFNQQWHLNNTGQAGGTVGNDIRVCQAWDITTGCANVTVAVIDHGLEFNHPDFNNISPISFDTETGTAPSVVRGDHGVPVAGVIGASVNNNLGVAGVAPNAQLMSISNSLAAMPASRQNRAAGINFAWQNGADIINNSWSSSVSYQIIDDAIINATNFGRNGRGTLVIFASGNDNTGLSYPSNLPQVIAVGAINRNASRANFSNYGNGLDVVAPGVSISTTDRQGAMGYNQSAGAAGDYTTVDGTSFAAPQVAGIAALLLSVNPGLTVQQVRNIIESTTDKVGGYGYVLGQGEQPTLTWNNQMGYGRVNAFNALQAIVTGPEVICGSGTFSIQNPLPGTTVSWTSSNPGGLTINQNTGLAVRQNNFSGAVTVTATINSGCGNSVISRTVWVGTPQITNMRVNNMSYFTGMNVQLCPGNHWLNVTPVGGNPGNASWTVPSGIPHFVGTNTLDFTYPQNYSNSLTISVRASNACGQGANANFFLSKKTFGCTSSFSMVIYPNPAKDQFSVEMMAIDKNAMTEEVPVIESAVLLDKEGREIAMGTRVAGKITFEVSNLQKGIYFIHVVVDGELTREQIIIE